MEYVTKFGRQKELWETDVAAFLKRGGILSDSMTGKAIARLSDDEFSQLVELCDPAEDAILHVDSSGCSINHGNVGTRGIRYDWR